MRYSEWVGPVLCEALSKALPPSAGGSDWRLLPDGTHVLVGVEYVFTTSLIKPAACAIDLGGDVPFILWKGGSQ